MEVDYLLSDSLWTGAEIHPTETVFLWLGASTMMEYSIEEALDILKLNKTTIETNVKEIDLDLE